MNEFLQRLWKVTRMLLRVLIIVWVVIVVLLAFVQRKLMYIPSVAKSLPVAASPIINAYPAATDVEFASGENTIRGWWLRAENNRDRPLVILFHGNTGNRAGRVGWYNLLHQAGCDVLAIDYQGYGDSEGRPSQAAVEADARATWDYAVDELTYDPAGITVMGVSLGGAAAVTVAVEQSQTDRPPAGLITVATFSSMVEVAADHYPWLPVRAVLQDRYLSAEKIPQLTVPFLHFHGDLDRVVGVKFGRQLFDIAPDESADGTAKRWVTLEDAGHNDILRQYAPLLLQEITTFVASTVQETAVR